MSTVTKSPFTRPTSVMSLLAKQMESSCIDETSLIEDTKSQSIAFKPVSNEHFNFSSSAPIHRYSIPDSCFSCLDPHNDSNMDHECRFSNESDISSPQLPSKRLCHSSTYDGIARPIPIKVSIKSHFNNNHENSNHFDFENKSHRMSCHKTSMTIKTPQRNPCNFTIRPIISPHYKKSAFTPTRYLTSPQTTSSDYSISPDMESPIHRPASLTSSGFHECSQQSLLIDPNCSPDSNQKSSCATIINTNSETSQSIFPRCHSQPCDEPMSRHFNSLSIMKGANKVYHKPSTQTHTPMKRRYPLINHVRSTSQSDSTSQNIDSPTYCHCNKLSPNSADTSPSACGSVFVMPKRDTYFFGNGRSYLISLPRIASSPPAVSTQSDQQSVTQSHRQRIGSNSSSLSTSTTTDANTPTVISNSNLQQKQITDAMNLNVDIEMDDSINDDRSTVTYQSYNNPESSIADQSIVPPHMWSDVNCISSSTLGSLSCASQGSSCSASATSDMTTKSYSTTSGGTSHCTNISLSINSEESSRSEFRDPDDPPEIGFCFSQLNDHPHESLDYDQHSSFQELDLDQIESN